MSDTWFSPPGIIAALGGAESFDLDPCSPETRPWPTARVHYSERDNGLLLPWFGRVWLNPPYSRALLARFLGRMAEHNHGVALVFAKTETEPFFRFAWNCATAVLFIRGRLRFHRADGRPSRKDADAPSVLIAYGNEDCDVLAAATIDGAFVPLRLPASMIVRAIATTWGEALKQFFAARSEPVPLAELYRAFADHPKTASNKHWQDKLRQALQEGEFERVDRGLWRRRHA